jgi:hypothetical protein
MGKPNQKIVVSARVRSVGVSATLDSLYRESALRLLSGHLSLYLSSDGSRKYTPAGHGRLFDSIPSVPYFPVYRLNTPYFRVLTLLLPRMGIVRPLREEMGMSNILFKLHICNLGKTYACTVSRFLLPGNQKLFKRDADPCSIR